MARGTDIRPEDDSDQGNNPFPSGDLKNGKNSMAEFKPQSEVMEKRY
jgi:hypothetical protein